jgi:uncharacterized protein YndB with AHSA1/START domain/ribosomal protein S18 acetylase RimI-like enzyme
MVVKVVKEMRLEVPPEEVWAALVAPDERRDWYYQQTAFGEWREGGRLEWRSDDGSLGEESRVLELDPPFRLVLESRWMFAPTFASEPPHLLRWEVRQTASGCRVTLVGEFERPGRASKLLESEGEGILLGLRLHLDPAARAENARRDEIGPIEVRDLTADRVGDYLRFFDEDAFRDYPAWQGCYCMETHWGGSAEEWAAQTAADNRAAMVRLIEQGQVTALLAYADERPVGWCNYGETTRLRGLLQRFGLEASQQEGVGSIACFVIAAPYRRHGVAAELLDAACERLQQRGLRWAEGYPRREGETPQAGYRGPLEMFLRAGFQAHREAGPTLIVRKDLAPESS